MDEERPFLQIPLPSPYEERKLFEEWIENKEKKEKENEDNLVIVVDI